MILKPLSYLLVVTLLVCQFIDVSSLVIGKAYPLEKVVTYATFLIGFGYGIYAVFLSKQKNKLLVNLAWIWFFVFCVLAVIQVAVIQKPGIALQWAMLATYPFFFLCAYSILGLHGFNKMIVAILAVNVLVSLLLGYKGVPSVEKSPRMMDWMVLSYGGISSRIQLSDVYSILPVRLGGMAYSPNGMGLDAMLAVIGLTEVGYKKKTLFLIGCLLVAAFLLSQSRASLLFTLLYLVLHYMMTHRIRLKGILTSTVLLMGTSTAFLMFNSFRMGDSDDASSGRLDIFVDMYHFWAEQDFVGYWFGMGRGYISLNMQNALGYISGVDNGYLNILVDAGLVGLILVMATFGLTIYYCWQHHIAYKVQAIFFIPFFIYAFMENAFYYPICYTAMFAFLFSRLERRGEQRELTS